VTETYDTRETFRGAATRWVDTARKSPEPLIRRGTPFACWALQTVSLRSHVTRFLCSPIPARLFFKNCHLTRDLARGRAWFAPATEECRRTGAAS
jgi:hypothetical protein